MTKVYVSFPMEDKKREEIINEQESLAYRAGLKLGKYVELISTCINVDTEHPLSPLVCLSHSLTRMDGADYVVFGEGWEQARGCKIERICAEQYGVPILELD